MTTAPLENDVAHLLSHDSLLRALIRDLVRDDQAADDVLQETWMTALARPPRERGALRSWLVTVARNRARQRGRGESRRERREQAVARPEALPSTDDLVERENRRRAVREHVLALPEPYRTALVLRYFEGLTPAEIAARQGLPAATVRTHLHRGLDRLRRRLDADHDGDRRAWVLAFAGLAGEPGDAPIPARVPWKTVALTAATCLGVIVCGTLFFASPEDDDPNEGGAQPDVAAAPAIPDEDDPGPAGRRRSDRRADPPKPEADPAPTPETEPPVDAPEPLRFRVVDARTRAAIDDAEVALVRVPRRGPDRELARTSPSKDGTATVAPDDRATHVRVRRTGYQPYIRRLLVHAGEMTCLLEVGVPVTGRVVLAGSGDGVPGVRLEVVDEARRTPIDRALETDAQGRFAVAGVPPNWRFSITARHTGFAPVSHIDIRAQPGPDIVLVLGEGATLTGRVTDDAGEGVPGAQVSVLTQEYTPLELSRSSRSAESQSVRSGYAAVCDEDGRYIVRGLAAPGTYVVAAHTERNRWTRGDPVVLGAGDEAATSDVVLGAPVASVLLRVLRPDGSPAGGAEVEVLEMTERPRRALVFVSTNEAGELPMQLTPSEHPFEVRVGAPGFAPGKATFRVPRAEPVVVQLEEGAALTGVVTDTSGRPVAGARLSYQSRDWRTKSGQRAESAADGSFVLRGLPGDRGTLRVTHPDHQMSVIKNPGDGPLAVELTPSPRFRGRFQPVPSTTRGIRLRVYGKHGGSSENDLVVGDDGSFDVAIPGRPGDPVHLLFKVPGHPPLLLRGRKLAAGDGADLGPLTLARGRSLSGSVRDDEGRPVAGVRVTARWALDDPEQRPFHAATTFTDAQGRYTFDGAPDRLLGVWVDQPGWVRSDDGDPSKTDIEMVRAGFLAGRLIPPAGTPRYGYPHVIAHGLSDGAQKRVVLEFVAREDAEDAARGRFHGTLRPGRYKLVIGQNDEPWQKALERTIEVRAGDTQHLELRAE